MSYIFFPSPTPIFPVLPPLSWSVHKKVIMSSRTITAATGRECQLARAMFPRWEFTLSYGDNSWLREQTQNIVPDPTLAGFTELEALSSLLLACRGAYGEFYYDDADDDSRSAAPISVGNGVTTSFPIYVPWGTGPFNPSLLMPVGGINTMDAVYFNGIVQDPSHYSVDATNTILNFVSPPPGAAIITADYHFYFRCRFLDDHQDYNQFDRNLWEVKEVRFESVKP